jgi:hypothetical protein
MENFGLQRLVNRNPGIVEHVLINGSFAIENEEVNNELGNVQKFGTFLAASS